MENFTVFISKFYRLALLKFDLRTLTNFLYVKNRAAQVVSSVSEYSAVQ